MNTLSKKEMSLKIIELEKTIIDLTSKLNSAESNYKWASEARNKFENEIDAIHNALDNIPNSPKRKYLKSSYEVDYSLSIRLLLWIANIAFPNSTKSTIITEKQD